MGRSTIVALILLSVLAAGAGCAPRTLEPLAPLPLHEVDLSARFKADEAGADDFLEKRPEWYARGNRVWRYIVIHHSATDSGSAAELDKAHRRRGWDEMGYHFVITNGQGANNGYVEVGSRWKKQKWGAHCGGTPANEYNEHGIGICLIGDFTSRMPSDAQLASLKELMLYLMYNYRISPANVISHCDAPLAHTACPGELFHKYLVNNLHGELAGELANLISDK